MDRGFHGMLEREASIPPQDATRIPEALEHLVQLYEERGNASQAAGRSKLEAARTLEPGASGNK